VIIYSATNLINGKKYIGQTNRELRIRIREHHCFSFHKNSSDPFHKALRKYGREKFKWNILCFSNNQEELNKMEIFYIQKHKTCASDRTGYNVREGGSNGRISKESREKMSKSHKGKILSKQHKKNISNKTKGNKNPRYIHLTHSQKMELYNDFTSCILTNKEIEEKYNMSRPTIYRKIKAINPNLEKDGNDKRYRSLTRKRGVRS